MNFLFSVCHSPLDGELFIRYEIYPSNCWDGAITATREGIIIEGSFPTMTTEDSVLFEEILARARVHHNHLAETGQALTEEAVDRILSPIPTYEARP